MVSQNNPKHNSTIDEDFEFIDALTINENTQGPDTDGSFERLATLITAQAPSKGPIFHTIKDPQNRDQLWMLFKSKLPMAIQQEMACRTCSHFVRQYGDLCVVGDDGNLIPLIWSLDVTKVPSNYKEAVRFAANEFVGKEVGEELILQKGQSTTLGTPFTGKWMHMSIDVVGARSTDRFHALNTQNTETSYTMLDRILRDNSKEVIERAYHIINDNQLPYAELHKDPLKYLKETAAKLEGIKNPVHRKNLTTRYARDAFIGCLSSLRGGMVGFLLELVAAGESFDQILKKWQTKADPLSYLRPTAAPSVGNIASAEKIFERLDYTPKDLERAYLTLEQVPKQAFMWSPTPDEKVEKPETQPKLFSSLLPQASKPNKQDFSGAPIQDCTFRHFAQKVLPTAKTISVLPNKEVQPWFFTVGKEGGKPIMSFHQEGSHTASWYTWASTGTASEMGLKADWTPVSAIITFPHMFDHFEKPLDILCSEKTEAFKFKRLGISVLFCLEGARETRASMGLALFPVMMRGDFHSVRSTLEAFSSNGTMEVPNEGAIVGGVSIGAQKNKPLIVGVVTKGGQVSRYQMTLFD